jgi:hypothetical protein
VHSQAGRFARNPPDEFRNVGLRPQLGDRVIGTGQLTLGQSSVNESMAGPTQHRDPAFQFIRIKGAPGLPLPMTRARDEMMPCDLDLRPPAQFTGS